MTRVVAILEVMWDWRQMTSGAGYAEAPRYFQINPQNHSGRRLYRLVGLDASLVVTNACRELVTGPTQHGTPDPVWLAENLRILDGDILDEQYIDLLLVCGKVAQRTFKVCKYRPRAARVIEIPHPAARSVWTREFIAETAKTIQLLKSTQR